MFRDPMGAADRAATGGRGGRTRPRPGAVERLEITRSSPVAAGRAFGEAGPYEKLVGRLHLAVDPRQASYASVVDLALARRDDDGRVRFAADLFLLRPADPRRGNRTLLVEVPNRGAKAAFRLFHREGRVVNDPDSPEDFADGFLMRRGYTLAWIGWQDDLPRAEEGLLRREEVAPEEEVEGLVRIDRVLSAPTQVLPLGHLRHRPYPMADPEDPRNRLTVRDGPFGRRRMVPRELWRFARVHHGKVVPDPHFVFLRPGFDPGRLYELVYVSRRPRVEGLGLTVVRDAVSFLRRSRRSPVAPRWTLATGASQSGRYLRHFLWRGLNRDAGGRRVFDGVLVVTGGAGRGSFDHRFAQPSIDGHATACLFTPVDLFPFADLGQRDPVTGEQGGILASYDPATRPKVLHVHTGYDYWGRGAALTHTTLDGKHDLEPCASSRVYHLAGTQHAAEPFPPEAHRNRHLRNPLDFQGALRALLVALRGWVAEGREPPPSRVPRVAAGELVPLPRLRFPPLPGVAPPRRAYRVRRLDFGPRFAGGVIDREPPGRLAPYPLLVPQVDADGNELAGLRMPELAAPLATYTSWNFPAGSEGSEWPAILWGSFLPFARSARERALLRDPRPAIRERYPGPEEYLARYRDALESLLAEGYLLEEDRDPLLERARRLWEALAEPLRATAAAGGAIPRGRRRA